jgi:nitrite reductase/ring-hydroxylating ferredoxin subunit
MLSSWTPVALSVDVPAGIVIPVRLDWAELAVWRSEAGRLAAWQDRCPHRGMRLSHGFVRGDMLSCLYHGWRYDAAGQCRKIPAHPDLMPPAAFCTRSFPCRESSGLVWVAPQPTEASPPVFPEGAPLCSISISASVQSVAAALQLAGIAGTLCLSDTASAVSVSFPGAGAGAGRVTVTVALQARPDGCTLHALMVESDGARRQEAIAMLEHQRRDIEAGSAAELAA